MNYVLDTHTFLWTISNIENISKKAIDVIKNSNNEIFISAVSLWEISIKVRIKKLDLDTIEPEELILLAEKMEFQLIGLSPEEAATYYKLKEETHNDPFDRMLIWQCISRNLPIISKDKEFSKFLPYGLKLIW